MEPEVWRERQYERMGFDLMRAKILAHSHDAFGVPVYWRKVEAAVDQIGLNAAYDLFVFEPFTAETA